MALLRTVTIVVGVPVLLLVVVLASNAKLDDVFRSALVEALGPIPADVEANAHLGYVCAKPEIRSELSLCNEYLAGQALVAVGFGAVILSVASLLLVVGASRYAGVNRERLAAAFRPALVLLLVILAILILGEGALAAGGGYLAEVAFTGGYHPAVLFGLGIAAILAAYGVLRAIGAIGRGITTTVNGRVVTARDHPNLFAFIEELSRASGTTRPDIVAVGLDPTFFVIDGAATTLDGPRRGRLLYLSLPLTRVLTLEELRAILGHELGHFRGQDTEYSRRFAPLYVSAIGAFGVVAAASRGLQAIVLTPTIRVLGEFLERFAAAERSVARSRELEADTVGASVASATAVASSLVKMQAFVPIWTDMIETAVRNVGLGKDIPNPSSAFADRLSQGVGVPAIEALEGTVVRHPTDSHPPLRERLANVNVAYDEVAPSALSGLAGDPASSLFHDLQALEASLLDSFRTSARSALGFSAVGIDSEAALRAAAVDDPGIRKVVDLVDRAHNGSLVRPVNFSTNWVALADLELEPHSKPHGFLQAVADDKVPSGLQLVVAGFATDATPEDRLLVRGVSLTPIGVNALEERHKGYSEDFYSDGTRVIVVLGVGSGEIAAQLAGLLLVPSTDPLAKTSGAYADEIAGLRAELRAWQIEEWADEDSGATVEPATT